MYKHKFGILCDSIWKRVIPRNEFTRMSFDVISIEFFNTWNGLQFKRTESGFVDFIQHLREFGLVFSLSEKKKS